MFCLLARSLAKSNTGAIWSRAHRPDRVVAKVEEMAWSAAPADAVIDLESSHRHLSITDPVGALTMFAMVPQSPDWNGGGVGSVWAQAPDGFDAVIRAALPDPPWLAELACPLSRVRQGGGMSDNASVILFYGVVLKPDTVPPYQETEPPEGPAWMAYTGKAAGEIRVFVTGHHDVPRLAVAIKSTVRNGRDWSALEVLPHVHPIDERGAQMVYDFLDRYGLRDAVDTGAPQWLAAPYYG